VSTNLTLDVLDAVQAVMCPAINVVFLSWVHFLMHGGIVGTLLPFIGGSLPALLVANWKVCACHTASARMSCLWHNGTISKSLPRTLQVICWALTGCPLLQVWPIANTIAFRYIPQDLRIIYQNVLGVAMVNAASCPPCSSWSGNCCAASGMTLHRAECSSATPCRAPT
jgi:Mpv17 / PMP22 family